MSAKEALATVKQDLKSSESPMIVSGVEDLPRPIALAIMWPAIEAMVRREEALAFNHKATGIVWIGLKNTTFEPSRGLVEIANTSPQALAEEK